MKRIIWKIIGLVLLVVMALLTFFYFQYDPVSAEEQEWGISFSHTHAEYLGFDWKEMYLDILNDLKPKTIRLMTYWDVIEQEKGIFDFQAVDEMLIEAGKQGVHVILVVGRKQPRWPECHNPDWFSDYSIKEQEEAQLAMVKRVVEHFRQFDAIKIWQVENEPLFNFGRDCTKTAKVLLEEEVTIVRSLDSRPVIVTDSGELGRWLPTALIAKPDIFGTTMYRVVHNPITGYIRYPLPPGFIKIKAGVLNFFTPITDIRGVELQAEPWFIDGVFKTSLEDQYSLMNPKLFQENIEYARNTGLKAHYLWGVEWWYWMAKEHNDWGMWDVARQLLTAR
jgi:hypothetical protein